MSFFSYRTGNPAALRQPCERPLDHPSPRLVALRSVAALLFLADPADVRGVSGCGRRPFPVGLSYALSRGVCLGFILCRFGPLDHDTLDPRRCQEPPFQDVRPGDHHPQRSTVAIGHQALFGAFFSSVGGILARLFPPRSGPCPASRRPAATPTAPRRVRHTRRPRPPRFARRSLLQPGAGTSRGQCSWVRTARAVGPTGHRCATGR